MNESLKKFKVAAVQMHAHVGSDALKKNLLTAENFIQKASEAKSQLVVLPETFNFGYNLKTTELKSQLQQSYIETSQFLEMMTKKYDMAIAAGIIELDENENICNRLVYYTNQKREATYDKVHLFKSFPTFEDQTFKPGQKLVTLNTPFGKLGFLICYDLRFPEISRLLALNEIDILIVSSAWGYARREHFRLLQKARAIENQCFIISSDQVGENDNQVKFAGLSVVLDPLGQVLAEADSETEQIIFAEIDLNQIQKVKEFMNCLSHRRGDVYEIR